ncbi:beta-1,4-galactosyltransferase 4-like [Procambarus clarkii]|uniref:beta-1,4-galactosyltransferase 4-like n=1 Tax=Procambarus clarkii TaxID=6728 RepID=UPI00374269E0
MVNINDSPDQSSNHRYPRISRQCTGRVMTWLGGYSARKVVKKTAVAYLLITTMIVMVCVMESSRPDFHVMRAYNTPSLPGCPSTPPHLRGNLAIEEKVNMSEAEARHRAGVMQGGFSSPQHCVARWSLAVIVPYRNRETQIGAFLNHMHPFLQRQQLNYSIYFVEQEGAAPFNRASLLNVGFKEARKEGPWDCYAFHDIDLLPENDFHLYHCSPQPRHLAVALSTFNYRNPYHSYFGGGCLMMESHILKVNGWSNMYWGWGGEDDDMWNRVTSSDMTVWRYPNPYVRYKMIQHRPAAPSQERYKLLAQSVERLRTDGLNSLRYSVITTTRYPLYTNILAHISPSAPNIFTTVKSTTVKSTTVSNPPSPPHIR